MKGRTWSVGSSDDKYTLPGTHTVDLSQNLVDHSVTCFRATTPTATTGLGDTIHLMQEDDTSRIEISQNLLYTMVCSGNHELLRIPK